MPKPTQPKKARSNNRVAKSLPPEGPIPENIQKKGGALQSSQSHLTSGGPEEPDVALTLEDIQKRAYYIHQEKGGSATDNWLEAERILKEEQNLAKH